MLSHRHYPRLPSSGACGGTHPSSYARWYGWVPTSMDFTCQAAVDDRDLSCPVWYCFILQGIPTGESMVDRDRFRNPSLWFVLSKLGTPGCQCDRRPTTPDPNVARHEPYKDMYDCLTDYIRKFDLFHDSGRTTTIASHNACNTDKRQVTQSNTLPKTSTIRTPPPLRF